MEEKIRNVEESINTPPSSGCKKFFEKQGIKIPDKQKMEGKKYHVSP